MGISRFAELCRTVIPSDGFLYPHHTAMIDTFPCIPFDLAHFDFPKYNLLESNTFSFKELLVYRSRCCQRPPFGSLR